MSPSSAGAAFSLLDSSQPDSLGQILISVLLVQIWSDSKNINGAASNLHWKKWEKFVHVI